MEVHYIQHYGDDLIVCNAARVSFDKQSTWDYQLFPEFPGSEDMEERQLLFPADEKLIHYLAKNKHTSCFEHMGATLKLKVPIFIARQIQRHRTFSYNEISRRYVDNEPEFFHPDKWRMRAETIKQGSSEEEFPEMFYDGYSLVKTEEAIKQHYHHSLQLYKEVLRSGMAPEQARMLLPQSMYTEFYMSGNLRAWSHFLHLRLDGHAQAEVRVVAEQVKDILTPLFPTSMEALLANE